MKTVPILLLIIIASICTGVALPEQRLADLAASKRAAALKMVLPRRSSAIAHHKVQSLGVFISDDGLALVDVTLLCLGQKPMVVTADGTTLKFGTILGIFPEQHLALMKFKHRPKLWLRLAPKEPEVGEEIALVTHDVKNTMDGVGPPVSGPIMAKRSIVTVSLQVDQFMRGLSLGTSLTQKQYMNQGGGWFAINRDGDLAAFFQGMRPTGRNTLIHLSPIVSIADQVEKLANSGQSIPFPLAKDRIPMDLAVLDSDWTLMCSAHNRRDFTAVRRLHKKLKARYPTSGQLKTILSKMDVAELEAEQRGNRTSGAEGSALEQIYNLTPEVNEKFGKSDYKGAIALMEKIVELSPKDHPGYREQLAMLYLEVDRLEDAERLFRDAYSSCPESIDLCEKLESLLIKQNKLKEADVMTKRIYELEKIYRRR